MSNFICDIPEQPKYSQRGLKGYKYPIQNNSVELFNVDVWEGHDTYIISKECTHIYYIIEGKGIFDIESVNYNITSGMVIEVPPNIEYTYTGKFKALLIMNPPWFEGNEIILRENPLVK